MFEYETMRLIWWVLIGIVITGFTLTEGFDFGVGALLTLVGKTDLERRVVINAVGATWEGNQVWLVLLGGAIFAIWPPVYATLFSGLYIAMMLLLFALFLRPAGFDYRSKIEHSLWRNAWDWALVLGGVLPPLLFGVLIGNLLIGLPFHLDRDLLSNYEGSFFSLLGPFQLLCGLVALQITTFHGAVYLKWRTDGDVRDRSSRVIKALGPTLILSLIAGAAWLILEYDRPEIISMAGKNAPSNPLKKEVLAHGKGWLQHFLESKWMLCAPLLAVLGFSKAWLFAPSRFDKITFLASSIGIIGVLFTVGFGLFPFLLISTIDPRSSLTIWDASSSHMVLTIALVISVIFLPIVLLYTRWVYRVMWGTITTDMIEKNTHKLY